MKNKRRLNVNSLASMFIILFKKIRENLIQGKTTRILR